MRLQSVKSKLGEGGGCEMASSCSDHARTILALSAIVNDSRFSSYFGMSRWRVSLAPRIVNDVSNVSRINHESHFSWQAQYSVMLEGVSWCSAHCLLTVRT